MLEIHQLLLVLTLFKIGLDPALVDGLPNFVVGNDRLGYLLEKRVFFFAVSAKQDPVSVTASLTKQATALAPLLPSELFIKSLLEYHDTGLNHFELVEAHLLTVTANVSLGVASLLRHLLQNLLLLLLQLKLLVMQKAQIVKLTLVFQNKVLQVLVVNEFGVFGNLFKDESLDSVLDEQLVTNPGLLCQ